MQRTDVPQAALAVAADNGAAGVDGQTLATITATAESRAAWLAALQGEWKQKLSRPSSVRRVWILKGSGKNSGQLPLGIPTVKDRGVQMAVYLVLMPIFEVAFHEQSYGFRPKRRAHQALDAIREAVKACREKCSNHHNRTVPEEKALVRSDKVIATNSARRKRRNPPHSGGCKTLFDPALSRP